jgi:hypothetical protein
VREATDISLSARAGLALALSLGPQGWLDQGYIQVLSSLPLSSAMGSQSGSSAESARRGSLYGPSLGRGTQQRLDQPPTQVVRMHETTADLGFLIRCQIELLLRHPQTSPMCQMVGLSG